MQPLAVSAASVMPMQPAQPARPAMACPGGCFAPCLPHPAMFMCVWGFAGLHMNVLWLRQLTTIIVCGTCDGQCVAHTRRSPARGGRMPCKHRSSWKQKQGLNLPCQRMMCAYGHLPLPHPNRSIIALCFLPSVNPSVFGVTCSKLWGCRGELFDAPNSTGSQRLLDWSYAGYMAGEMPIPKLPLVASVTDFGAVGDGVADDTQVNTKPCQTGCGV